VILDSEKLLLLLLLLLVVVVISDEILKGSGALSVIKASWIEGVQ
jgi:hypothetical protein